MSVAHSDGTLLHMGQSFPHLEISAVDGGTIFLPEELAGSYGVVLIYRGAWCPYCNAQLAAFSRASEKFAELGIKVVALSVDDESTSAALAEKHRLHFPVGYGADARAISNATGAFVNDEPLYLESTDFILAPDGTVLLGVYSTGAIGRLMPDDVAGFVRYAQAHS